MSMKPVALDKVFKFFDNGGIFLASANYEGDTDVMPVGWTCPIQLDSIISMVSPGHYTRNLIDKSGKFALMVPTLSIVKIAAMLGTTSKHNNPNKLQDCNAKFLSPNNYGIPILEGCSAFAIFEKIPCSIRGPICGKALYAEADDELFHTDRWVMEDVPPIKRNLRYATGGQWYVDGEPILIELDWTPPK